MTTSEFQELKQLFQSISTELGDLKGLKADVESLRTDVEGIKTDIEGLKTDVEGIKTDVEGLKTDIKGIKTDIEKSNERFANYQQATQWVVQLAFSLIASATVIVIISNVLNR